MWSAGAGPACRSSFARKRLHRRITEVQAQFRDPPVTLFEEAVGDPLSSNHITLRIQPVESITLSFLAKEPGREVRIKPARMLEEFEGDRTVHREG